MQKDYSKFLANKEIKNKIKNKMKILFDNMQGNNQVSISYLQ